MARILVPGQNLGFPENVSGASGELQGLPLSPPVPLVGPLGPQRAKSRPSASRAPRAPLPPRAPLLTPMLGPGPLWRPKNEDSSIKIKRFGSNLFNLMELSSFFGRNRVPGGFQGVLRAAGTFSGQIPARKNIKSGLNRFLSQPFWPILIQSGAVVPPGLWRLQRLQRPLWRLQRPLWGPQRLLWSPQRRLWRPKNEDSSIKIKGFGSNLFNLMELSSFFGRNRVPGGFPGVLGSAGTFSGQKRPLEGAGKNPIWPESNS